MRPPTTRLRVLMISDVYFPRINGVSTSIATFRRDLAQLGCESLLIAPRYPQTRDDEPGVVRVPSRYLPFDPEDRVMRGSDAFSACTRLGGRLDVVHIQTPFVAHNVGLRVARRLGCATVETYHTYFEHYFHHYVPWLPKRLLAGAARGLSRTQCNGVDRVVAPSDPMADVLRGYGVRTPVEIVPTGLDLRDFESGDGARFRAQHGIAPERPIVLHVGRIAHEKNIGFIVDVVDRARREVPNVLLIIAGEGPAAGALRKRVAALGLDDHVLFVGYLDRHTALCDCYRAADVLAFASNTETQGLVPLESMASGTPVVSTAVLGTAQIIGPQRGAIAVREDTEEFSRAVVDVLRRPDLRQRLAQEARQYVIDCWSSTAMATRLLALYAELVSRHPLRAEDTVFSGS